MMVLILWILAYKLFSNLGLSFYKFLIGSLGLFTISIFFFIDPLESLLTNFVTGIMDYISNIIPWYSVFEKHSIITIQANDGIISILINYECSGIIELLVYSSLIIFFPVKRVVKKIGYFIYGNIFIICANIIRLLFIIGSVHLFGTGSYYIVHTVLARILFFVLMVILYYQVFTKTHINQQKVGDIR